MRNLRVIVVVLAIVGVSSVASASEFMEDFESYAAGSEMHGQGGWKGWDNVSGAGSPASDLYAFSGSTSVEIISSADLVHVFDISGGRWELSAMQYIPSGTTGITYFILLNQYSDEGSGGLAKDWSAQTQFDLGTGAIIPWHSGAGQIVYDQWVELKYIIDLDNNTVDKYYNGELIGTDVWDDNDHGTLQCIDLFGNGASSVYYDDIKIVLPTGACYPDPADGVMLAETWVNLGWLPGGHAVSHDLYFGENFDDVNEGTGETFRGNQLSTDYIIGFPGFPYPDGLVPGTTYYWRIDEVNDANPNSPWRGDVWSFTIPPRIAYNPDPADGVEFVDPDVELSWMGGFRSKLHHVYFGDNFDDVNSAVVGIPQAETTYTPGTLELEKFYYWRIDEFDGATTLKGDVWSFKTKPVIPITVPNLVGWWKLDEGAGSNALDWSGHNNDGILLGDPQWIDGYDGGALELDGSGDIVEMRDYKGVTGTQPRTCCAWIKTENLGEIISWGNNVAGQKWIFRVQESNGTVGAIRVEVNGGYIVGVTDVRDGQWHHVAAVLEENAAPDVIQIKLYLDGALQDVSAQLDEPIDTASGSNVRIGEAPWHNRPFTGQIDNVRIYDKALTQEDIPLAMRGDPLVAWDPNPANGSTPYIRDATPLNWSPGDNASQHDVYFGTDKGAVADADASDTTGIYRGRQGVTIYTPPDVEWGGGPYYWRIDEYNTDATISKGNVCSFTVTDYILVEDFEDYNDYPPDEIFSTWIDGFGTTTNGALIAHDDPPFAETTVVHGGRQSMAYRYDNNFKYSEATLTLVSARDWTKESVRVLSLWFNGDASNAAERMYVALNGSAVVYHDNPNAAQINNWTQWTIDLQKFAAQGVNLANVNTISIGFGDKNNLQAGGSGMVYFDDIRLYRSPPVGHWKLDDGAGTIAVDSSGNGNDGTLIGDPQWTTGIIGGALDFDGESYVDCGNDAILDITGPISMAIWISPGTDGSVETAPLCKADASAGWSWQLRYGWNTDKPTIMGFQFNATGGSVWVYVEQELPIGEWYHIAASHDGATVKCYLDGMETDSAPMSDFAGGPSTLLIGSDGWRSDWIGAIDDVRIYDRALSEAEVLELASK